MRAMSDEPTWCENCQHRREAKVPWHDYCVMHPRLAGFGFVRRTEWDQEAPFLRCHQVNGGACPLYEPLETGEQNAPDNAGQ